MARLSLPFLAIFAVFCLSITSSASSPAARLLCEVGLLPKALAAAPATNDLNFEMKQGREENYFIREGGNAVHTAITSGKKPSVVVAFAAQNSADTLWLDGLGKDVTIDVTAKPRDYREGALQGVSFVVSANTGKLRMNTAILGSIRHARDYEHEGTKPKEITENVEILDGNLAVLSRKSIDGTTAYRMQISLTGGTIQRTGDGMLEFISNNGANLQFAVTALSSEPQLTPLPLEKMIDPAYLHTIDSKSLQMLSFLFYREKFLAGSWRYLTYFGRDSMIMALLLMDIIHIDALESVIGSVLNRMNADGVVAHEEDIGDFASWRNAREGRGVKRTPIYDYKMIDDDFLLSGLMRAYLKKASGERVASFLGHATDSGRTYREALKANLTLVLQKTQSFTDDPRYKNLISLHDGEATGTWRDSRKGLGEPSEEGSRILTGGRYPFDVNVALVPMALQTAAQIFSTQKFGLADPAQARRAQRSANVWNTKARALFQVEISAAEANSRADSYSRSVGLKPMPPVRSPVRFSAIALDAQGAKIKVMHSDEAFELLLNQPDSTTLQEVAQNMIRPFPYGLVSRVGLMVANPAFADLPVQNLFTRKNYHGSLVWSWPMAMMARGLRTQLLRTDLSPVELVPLAAAERTLWKSIESMRAHLSAELWTWFVDADGHEAYAAFGQSEGDDTASNVLQGWSLAFLGVKNPFQPVARTAAR